MGYEAEGTFHRRHFICFLEVQNTAGPSFSFSGNLTNVSIEDACYTFQ